MIRLFTKIAAGFLLVVSLTLLVAVISPQSAQAETQLIEDPQLEKVIQSSIGNVHLMYSLEEAGVKVNLIKSQSQKYSSNLMESLSKLKVKSL
jgi:hypothetical protein